MQNITVVLLGAIRVNRIQGSGIESDNRSSLAHVRPHDQRLLLARPTMNR